MHFGMLAFEGIEQFVPGAGTVWFHEKRQIRASAIGTSQAKSNESGDREDDRCSNQYPFRKHEYPSDPQRYLRSKSRDAAGSVPSTGRRLPGAQSKTAGRDFQSTGLLQKRRLACEWTQAGCRRLPVRISRGRYLDWLSLIENDPDRGGLQSGSW